jgi:voltage-gated potassium channel
VTLTTVGYGDIVPTTTTGRWAGITIMITGISVLGLLAGSLASFLHIDSATGESGSPEKPTPAEPGPPPGDWAGLVAEMAALREQVELLSAQLTKPGGEHRP